MPDVKIDKSAYGKLNKIALKDGFVLGRGADGVLTLGGKDVQPQCVVPSNLHLEGNIQYSLSDLADLAVLQGTVVSASEGQANEAPSVKAGVQLVFVANLDTELAEFLRAQRAASTVVWQRFISQYPNSSHAADAKNSLAGLFEESAEDFLAQYQKAAGADRWTDLKQAWQFAEQATLAVPGYAPAVKSSAQVNAELDDYNKSDTSEFEAYRKALSEQTAGYAHLTAAKRLNDQILDVNATYAPGLALQSQIAKEQVAFDAALQKCQSLLAANRQDEAFAELGGYRFFATEAPAVDSIISAVYTFHFNRGKEAASKQEWDKAIAEFRKAVETRSDSDAARDALKDAEVQLANSRDRDAAQNASDESKTFAAQKQYIDAYEVLANLPDAQRLLVTDQMEALKGTFVPAAVQRAQSLQEVHVPIRGRADEDAVRQAYHLLARASALTDDQSIKLKRDLLSDKISSYYVEQAKRYLEKPMASGVALGWCYLGEAQRFKQNLETVKDAMERYGPSYQLRSNISVEVVIRDQTSRRENAGFADQLTDAISGDLENSGLPVKVFRRAQATAATVEPLFRVVGEIDEYRKVKNRTLETLQSKYRAGIIQVQNPDWLQAKREYESAQDDVANAQHAVERLSNDKKKEIAAAKETLSDAQKKAGDLRVKLDAIEQTRPQDVVETYNYTKTTIDLTGIISVAFRIVDLGDNLIEPTTPVKQQNHKVAYVLDGVQPTDTEGVKALDSPPDEADFMTDLENQTRDALSKAIHDKILRVPAKILERARTLAQQNDLDGAGEWYVIYLNATSESTPERDEAMAFLREHFNVVPPARQSPTTTASR